MFVAKDLRPMLATRPAQPPALTVAGFVSEPKYDGIRAIVEVVPPTRLALSEASAPRGRVERAAVRLWSRNGNEKTAQFPDIVEAVGQWGRKLPGPVVLDAVVIAVEHQDRNSHAGREVQRIDFGWRVAGEKPRDRKTPARRRGSWASTSEPMRAPQPRP